MQLTKSFPLFPNLPAELRDKIWLYTVDWRSHILPRPPIAELAVCHEARSALLKVYRPCFRPVPKCPKDDIEFSVESEAGERWVQIQGMGSRSPRSPYANYATDVLDLYWDLLYRIQQGDPLQKFLFQEAIENVRHVLMSPDGWAPITYCRPGWLLEAPLPPLRSDSRLLLTCFDALETLSLADEPKLKVNVAALDQDQTRKQRDLGRWLDDVVQEHEQSALRSRFAEGKILIPGREPTTDFADPDSEVEEARQWIDVMARKLPGWGAPEVQYATIIPDPQG